jgi:hypothetical protein
MKRSLVLVILVFVAFAGPASASPQVVDDCGETGTGVEAGGSSAMLDAARDLAFDVEAVSLATVFDQADTTPVGVSIALKTCATALPAVELSGTHWLVRWNTPNNAQGEPCNATVQLGDSVYTDNPQAGVVRKASLYQVCTRPATLPPGASEAYIANSADITSQSAIDGGTVTWTLPFASVPAWAKPMLAPGVAMSAPVGSARDGRRATELSQGDTFELHLGPADTTPAGESYTIGSR